MKGKCCSHLLETERAVKINTNSSAVQWVYFLHLVLPIIFCIQISSAEAQSVDQKISRLINIGQIEAAQELLEASDPTEIDGLFFIGRILKTSQLYEKAVQVFEEILRREPLHLNAKRELAHTLLLSRQFRIAETRFRELLRDDNNEIMQSGYRRFLDVIENNKISGVNLQFSLLPSSNINKGTSNTIFDSEIGEFVIDPSMQVESGVGVQVEVSGIFRPLITAKSRVQLGWSVSGIKYDNDSYDSLSGQLSLSYLENSPTGHWSLETHSTIMLLGKRLPLRQSLPREAYPTSITRPS